MLERITHNNGLITYQSPLLRGLGISHGFTTRIGGYSTTPYESLNLGVLTKGPQSDANTSVAENFRRIRAALGLERIPRYELRQVHGGEVITAPDKPVQQCHAPCADAIITDQPGKLLCIRTADCVPILLATRDGRRIGAVHAGWRGLVAGVIEAAVGRMGGEVVAAVGPCISAECFEVGEEVAAQFDAAFVRHDLGDKPHIDLLAAALARLASAGVREIDSSDRCTYRDEAEFFSHRRDVTHKGLPNTGRMAALITKPR